MTTRYVNQFTLGNLLTIIALVVAGFVAWNTTQTRISLLEQRSLEMQRQFDEAMVETRRVRPDIEARLRAVETRFGAVLVEIQGLQGDIGELKNALRETNVQLREVGNLLRQANGEKP